MILSYSIYVERTIVETSKPDLWTQAGTLTWPWPCCHILEKWPRDTEVVLCYPLIMPYPTLQLIEVCHWVISQYCLLLLLLSAGTSHVSALAILGSVASFSKFLEFFIYPVYGHVPSPLPQMASTAEVGLGSVSEAPRMHCTKQLQACATGLPHLDKLLTHDYCIKPTLKWLYTEHRRVWREDYCLPPCYTTTHLVRGPELGLQLFIAFLQWFSLQNAHPYNQCTDAWAHTYMLSLELLYI